MANKGNEQKNHKAPLTTRWLTPATYQYTLRNGTRVYRDAEDRVYHVRPLKGTG